jgi:hypothetical protein
MFVSISNHPLSEWPKKQLDAALELGGGEIREIPFPSPSGDATTEEVLAAADRVAALVPDEAVVMVHGENVTAYAIAKRLRARSMRVVAPRHPRREPMERRDGKTVVVKEFLFTGWLDYE